MGSLSPFDDKYWNLAQASAWVVYREKQLVEHFKTADRNSYVAFKLYPTMWPEGRPKHGSIADLERALVEQRLLSWGHPKAQPDILAEIPSAEWSDLVIRPPIAFVSGQSREHTQRWTDIRVLSTDIKRLWRSSHEVNGRSKFDWDKIKGIYHEVASQNPEMSQNEHITETQGAFEDRCNRKPPSRSTLQRKIKSWS